MTAQVDPKATDAKDPIRVMIVDDSVVVRGLVGRWLAEDHDINIVASVSNGLHAVAEIGKVDPDIVILDIEMPEMDGLTALPLLLKAKPGLTVIMASTLTLRNAEISIRALSLGARDYIPKPESNSGVTTSIDFRREVTEKVKALGNKARMRRHNRAAGITPTSALRTTQPTAAHPTPTSFKLRPFSNLAPKILAIGSSTGGPQALMEIFTKLAPIYTRVPIVITQHMPATFTTILAQHLGRVSGVESAEAKDGEVLKLKRIYVAPGGKHMVLQKDGDHVVVRLEDGPPVNFCKPAVDPLFESVAKVYGATSLAVVLTGMGADGAKGAGIIADAGGSVLAQDEATSVVWGMPGATAQYGNASAVLPLQDISQKIIQLVSGAR